MKTRNAAVEGRFYPSTKNQIFEQIVAIEHAARYPLPELKPERVFGAVLPHAGHLYSGHQTIPFFRVLNRLEHSTETFVIVHPNHSGYGTPVSIDDADVWSNSIGKVSLDREFAESTGLPLNHLAQLKEHSAEVIIPYLQYYLEDRPYAIVPVCMLDQSHESALAVAEGIRRAVELTGRNIMILASSDFSHFLSAREGRMKDQFIIDQILSRNAKDVEHVVKKHNVSACGYGPIMSLMEYAAGEDPGYQVRILARGHSGEVTATQEVVDYVTMMIYR